MGSCRLAVKSCLKVASPVPEKVPALALARVRRLARARTLPPQAVLRREGLLISSLKLAAQAAIGYTISMTTALKHEIKRLARESVRKVLTTEMMRLRASLLATVSKKEQRNIDTLYKKPSGKAVRSVRVTDIAAYGVEFLFYATSGEISCSSAFAGCICHRACPQGNPKTDE